MKSNLEIEYDFLYCNLLPGALHTRLRNLGDKHPQTIMNMLSDLEAIYWDYGVFKKDLRYIVDFRDSVENFKKKYPYEYEF